MLSCGGVGFGRAARLAGWGDSKERGKEGKRERRLKREEERETERCGTRGWGMGDGGVYAGLGWSPPS